MALRATQAFRNLSKLAPIHGSCVVPTKASSVRCLESFSNSTLYCSLCAPFSSSSIDTFSLRTFSDRHGLAVEEDPLWETMDEFEEEEESIERHVTDEYEEKIMTKEERTIRDIYFHSRLKEFTDDVHEEEDYSPEERTMDLLNSLTHFDDNAKDITLEKHLTDDLSLNSLDVVECVLALEDEWDIEIEKEEAGELSTVQECVDLIKQKSCTMV